MNKESKLSLKNFTQCLVLFAVFILYTVVVKFVDVSAIGPMGSTVGLSGINGAFAETFGYNEAFYQISKYLGYAVLGVAACFAFLGLFQLVTRKSIKEVDPAIMILGGFYLIVIGFYVLFEAIVINYRPVILDEGLEASYPSSHTMLAICVAVSGLIMLKRYIKNRTVLTAVRCFLIAVTAAVVVFRLFSGVHWFSDILGSVILSASLCAGFKELVSFK